MLSPSANFQTAIAEDTLKIAEIYDVALANGTTYYFTSHSKDIVWNAGSDIYIALDPITRGTIQSNIDLEVDVVEIRLGNIAGPLFTLVQNNTLNSAKVVIKRIRWDQSYAADEEIICFVGIADISFDRQELVLSCKSIFDSLNIQVPRNIYQESCNYDLYDDGCTLIQSDFEYQGTISTGDNKSFTDVNRGTVYKGIFDAVVDTLAKGETITGSVNSYTAIIVQIVYTTATTGFIWYVELSNSANFDDDELLSSAGDSVTLNGVPVADPTFYPQGEVKINTGLNAGERRQILRDAGNATTVMMPFPNDLVNGDTYSIYLGCDKRGVTCRDKLDNKPNFRGFLFIARPEEAMS